MADQRRTVLNKEELETEILKRMHADERCADITNIQVKSSGLYPPQPTWEIASVTRVSTPETRKKHNAFVYSIINDMRAEFDLLPE